jgi:hypothetical protein
MQLMTPGLARLRDTVAGALVRLLARTARQGSTLVPPGPAPSDIAQALCSELVRLRASAVEKLAARHHWSAVGSAEACAHALLSLATEVMPRVAGQTYQARVAEAYVGLSEDVYRAHFSNLDEDGFGVCSFQPFLRLCRPQHWVPHEPRPDDLSATWERMPVPEPGIPPRLCLRPHPPPDGFSQTWTPDTTTRPESLQTRAIALLTALSGIVDSEELAAYRGQAFLPPESDPVSFGIDRVIASTIRGTRLLSLAGIPFDPLRTGFLQLLQRCLEEHPIRPPLCDGFEETINPAMSDFLSQAIALDSDLKVPDHAPASAAGPRDRRRPGLR